MRKRLSTKFDIYFKKNPKEGPRDMAQWLRVLVALLEDPNYFLSLILGSSVKHIILVPGDLMSSSDFVDTCRPPLPPLSLSHTQNTLYRNQH